MELKTYQANSMAEALEKVKKDLGRNAVILHTRTIRKGGVMGVGSRMIVEITASRDSNLLPAHERPAHPSRRSYPPKSSIPARVPAPVASAPGGKGAAKPAPVQGKNVSSAERMRLEDFQTSTSALRGEMEELRQMVRQLLDRPTQIPQTTSSAVDKPFVVPTSPFAAELQDYYTRLIQNAVADELAREVINRAKERLNEWQSRLDIARVSNMTPPDFQNLISDALTECIERMLPKNCQEPVSIDQQTRFIALVGPTGVGKTTTIAKLAAQFKLRQNKRVGLITTDTYRIAAVEQLRSYAEILSVPLEVVYTPGELAGTLQRMRDYDVVLIDTSGRSQKDRNRLNELQAFLDTARQAITVMNDPSAADNSSAVKDNADFLPPTETHLETHLVLSCTSHPALLNQIIEKFSPLGIDRVVFTKLDEAVGVGVVLNIAHRLNVQLSYLTTGQDVPDDIEVGHRRRIAEMVLKQNLPEQQDDHGSKPNINGSRPNDSGSRRDDSGSTCSSVSSIDTLIDD